MSDQLVICSQKGFGHLRELRVTSRHALSWKRGGTREAEGFFGAVFLTPASRSYLQLEVMEKAEHSTASKLTRVRLDRVSAEALRDFLNEQFPKDPF